MINAPSPRKFTILIGAKKLILETLPFPNDQRGGKNDMVFPTLNHDIVLLLMVKSLKIPWTSLQKPWNDPIHWSIIPMISNDTPRMSLLLKFLLFFKPKAHFSAPWLAAPDKLSASGTELPWGTNKTKRWMEMIEKRKGAWQNSEVPWVKLRVWLLHPHCFMVESPVFLEDFANWLESSKKGFSDRSNMNVQRDLCPKPRLTKDETQSICGSQIPNSWRDMKVLRWVQNPVSSLRCARSRGDTSRSESLCRPFLLGWEQKFPDGLSLEDTGHSGHSLYNQVTGV